MCGSAAGSNTAVSIPLRIPASRPRLDRSTPSSPSPYSVVMISAAYDGLTVLIMSLYTIPRAMKLKAPAMRGPSPFSTRPPSVSPATDNVSGTQAPW